MAVLIVDEFQTVHVEQHHAERTLRAAGTVEFRLQHANQAAVIRQPGERIADRHGAHLFKQTSLIQQSSRKHHHVAERLAQLRKEKRPVEKLTRKRRGDVADCIQRSHDQQRIVEEACAALLVLFFLNTKTEAARRDQIKRRRQQVPRTRQNVLSIRYRRGGSRKKGRAGQVSCQGHDKKNSGGLLARFARRGHVAFHSQCRQQKDRKQGPADHPPKRNFRKNQRFVVERIVKSKVADGLKDSRQGKPEGKNQRGAVMRAAKTNQRVCGIAVAQKRPAHFEVKISLRRSGNGCLSGIEDGRKKERHQREPGSDR